MIARLWHGVTLAEKADQYLEFLQAKGTSDYRATPGFRGVQILRSIHDERAEFLLISLWESFDAIRAFVGDDLEKAFYYPEDQDFLLAFEPKVQHYEVMPGPQDR
jgi:heme-degrading monooxygenase HmoA